MKLSRLLFLVALCVTVQSVVGDDGQCEDWHGDGGCSHDCFSPGYKCCARVEPVCFPTCPKDYCVHDPEFCVDKLVEDCKIVPKQVCVVKPDCDKVKKRICKDVLEDKCVIEKKSVCKVVDDCKRVPVQKCDKVCVPKNVCDDDGDRGSFARGTASARGSESASASASAHATEDSADATAHADATGEGSEAFTDTFARTGRRMKGCRTIQDCKDKCFTDHELKCDKKQVCDEVPERVCKKVPVHKCFDDWVEVCKDVKKCDFVDDKVCNFVKKRVCKDKVKCGDYHCDEWYKCNPVCCPDKKVPKCIEVKKLFG